MEALSYPPSLENQSIYAAYIQFDIYNRENSKNSSLTDSIFLYMPRQLSIPSTVSWSDMQLGTDGNAISSFYAGTDDKYGSVGDALMKGAGNAAMSFAGDALRAFGVKAQSGNTTAENVIEHTVGVVSNPFLTMMFKGVNLRHFSYQFEFYPRTEAECDLIYRIITKFRACSLPKKSAAFGGAYLAYPDEFEIKYKWLEGDNPFMHKFKRSVLTQIDTNYTSTGMFAMMRNGMPAFTVLNLKFEETQIVLREDVEAGF